MRFEPRHFLLAAALATVSRTLPAQDKPVEAPPKVTVSPSRAWESLQNEYKSYFKDYNDKRVRAARLGEPGPQVHPAREYYARFEALATGGTKPARVWLIENLRNVFDDAAERGKRARELFAALVHDKPDDDTALRGLLAFQSCLDEAGQEAGLALVDELGKTCADREVQARCIVVRARMISEKGRTKDPEKRAIALELQRSVVASYPETKAAVETAGVLVPAVEEAFLANERAWVARVLELQAAGEPPESWPPQPMHDSQLSFLPLAQVGESQAKRFAEDFYPRYKQAESLGRGASLAWLVRELATVYGARSPEWNDVRVRMLCILFAQFPDAPFAIEAIEKLGGDIEWMAGGTPTPALELALAKFKNPEARANALFSLAMTQRRGTDERSYLAAIASFERFVAEFKNDARFTEATRSISDLKRVMPGAPAPDLRRKDADGLEVVLSGFRPKVVLLDFWQLDDAFHEQVKDRLAITEHFKDRPFTIVGVNVDRITPVLYHKLAGELGVTWRSIMLYQNSSPILDEWQVRHFPSAVLIDSDGVIRARDLPWPKMQELADKLVLEAEARAAKK
jgi:hypothetical protein